MIEEATALIAARRALARFVLGGHTAPEVLGSVTLRPHQRSAVVMARRLIELYGGAVIADDVGLGKTFTALATVDPSARPLVLAPAGLRAMWKNALAVTGIDASLISFEWLSRHGAPPVRFAWVIIDEAHHLRSTATRRYAAAATLCRGAKVLLLTATPVQNRLTDIASQVALFAGSRSHGMTDDELGRLIIRRERRVEHGTPQLRGPYWQQPACDDDLLEELLALPAPLPAADEGEGGALLVHTLVRRWASSRAALVGSLTRRLAKAAALEAALDAGRLPTRRELATWCYGEGSVQLTFAELLASPIADAGISLGAVRIHRDAVRQLLRVIRARKNPDPSRADVLREIRRAHPAERVIAFSQFAETITGLASHLRADPHVASLTAAGARASGESLPRRVVLEQLGPPDASRAGPPAALRIGLLLTTDALSEGLNLQEASVVVHLDLPWNPARLQQRVGRVLRLGSRHPSITVYAMAPPAGAEQVMQAERRLRMKLKIAGRIVGGGMSILPSLDAADARDESAAGDASAISMLLEEWSRLPAPPVEWDERAAPVVVGAATASSVRFIAAISDGERPLLVVGMEWGISVALSDVRRTLAACDGPARAPPAATAHALGALESWWLHRRGRAAVDDTGGSWRWQEGALARISTIVARTQRHARSDVAVLAHRARAVIAAVRDAGAEHAVAEQLAAPLADLAWLRALAEFSDPGDPARAFRRRCTTPDHAGLPLRVLIVFQRGPASHGEILARGESTLARPSSDRPYS